MINSQKLNDAGIDYNAGLKRFLNDTDLYEAVLNAFLSVDLRENAKKAFDNRDIPAMIMAIHEAKGSGGNAGFTTLYNVSAELVSLLRSNNFSDNELVEQYNRFENEYTKVYEGIKAALD